MKTFIESIGKEVQKPKIQNMLKYDLLNPLLNYILQTFAPYFMFLCGLLIIIIILLSLFLVKGGWGIPLPRPLSPPFPLP